MFAWLDKNDFPFWVYLLNGLLVALAMQVVLSQSDLPFLQIAPVVIIGGVLEIVLFTYVANRIGRWFKQRKQLKARIAGWDEFLKHRHIVGGELEVVSSANTVRGRIRALIREGDSIIFDRAWLAEHIVTDFLADNPYYKWDNLELREGTDLRISAKECKAPLKRADDTWFINVPSLGSVIIYPSGHFALLNLKKTVTLEPAAQPAEQPIN